VGKNRSRQGSAKYPWLRFLIKERRDQTESRKLYGRKKGRPLGLERTHVMQTLLPALSIPAQKLTEQHDLDPASLFDKPYTEYWLEIGFGQGEHVAALMRENPNIGYLGAEPFINGVAGFLKEVREKTEEIRDQKNLTSSPLPLPSINARILNDDGIKLAASLKPTSINGIYVLNPDPWPKKRHHERRIINPQNLDILAKILKPGGQLILSTDVPDLADWMITHTHNHPAFDWQAYDAKDFWTRPDGWFPTRYELKKANHSSRMCYLIFVRK
jgi:tRNA (guanine-N7-)-methyltransferase